MLNRRPHFSELSAPPRPRPAAGLQDSRIPVEWGSPVFDLHFHMRGQTAANVAHLEGAGITSANLLTRAAGSDQVRASTDGSSRPFHMVLQRRSVFTGGGSRHSRKA